MAFIPSLTGLACLAGLALLIRLLRRAESPDEKSETGNGRVSRYGKLSKSALHMLIETIPVPYSIVDVRGPITIRRHPAPEILRNGLGPYLPVIVEDIHGVFYRRASGEFSQNFPSIKYPNKDNILVFVSDSIEQSRQGVEEAQSVGFTCSVYLEDGISSMGRPPKARRDVCFLSRHAVAVLLRIADSFSPVEATVIDLRRPDEHVAYGSIEGTKSLPVAELPRALRMEKGEFLEKYQFPKPNVDEIIVLSCRTNKRSSWAALLCSEAGYQRVYVHRTGVFGWQFSSSVKKYGSYDKGDEFPPPIPFDVEKPDRNAGLRELSDVGLTGIGRLDYPQHGRCAMDQR